MEVILLERVEKLGAIGDVVNVKDGFARMYLLPNKKALRSNAANRKVFEANRARIIAHNAARRAEAERDAVAFEGLSVTLIRQASDTGQLYGSVAVRDLVEALVADGHKVARSQIVLDKPIKAIGLYDVRVALHPELSVTVKINVARSPDEADKQAKGVDVLASLIEHLSVRRFVTKNYDLEIERAVEMASDSVYRTALYSDLVTHLDELPERTLDEIGEVLTRARRQLAEPDEIAGKGLGQLVSLKEGRAALTRIATEEAPGDWAQSELLGATNMAAELGVSSATLANWRTAGHVVAFKRGPRNYVYPRRQGYRGTLIEGLAEVTGQFGSVEDAWEWLVTPNPFTLGMPPIDRLRLGKREEVLRAAEGSIDFA